MSEKFIVEGGLSIPSGKNLEIAGVNLSSITTGSTLGSSASAIPSEYSVKAYVDAQLGASDIDLKLDGNTQTSIDQSTGKLGFASTANEIEIAYAHDGTDGVFTLGLPDDVTIGNDLTVTNDLTVSGSIAGSADEMIISADGNEASASGGASSTLTLNASAGIFTDANVDIDGTLDVAGATSLAAPGTLTDVRGTLSVDEAATFDSTVQLDGEITGGTTGTGTSFTFYGDDVVYSGESVYWDKTTAEFRVDGDVNVRQGLVTIGDNTDSQGIKVWGSAIQGEYMEVTSELHLNQMGIAMDNSARKDFSVSPAGSATTVFTFDDTAYKSAKIVASIEDASGNVTAQEILVVSDGTNAKALVYGTVSSGTEVSTTWAISSDMAGTATVTCNATGTLKGHYDLQAV